MKVGLTIPLLNNFEGAAELIASVKSEHDILINIQPQWRAQVSLAAAWNRGIEQAIYDGCEYVLVSNDDVMLAPYTIDRLVDEYRRLRGDGVILVSANNILGQLPAPHAILDYEETAEVSVADHPNYSCFLVHKDFFELHGRFDENFWPAWYEDSDSHYRIHLLGYRAVCTTAAPSVHIGSVTTHRLPVADSSQSNAYFLKKWGSVRRELNEEWQNPYNDPALSPKDWRAA